MGFLYFLEGIRMPGLNEIMLLITRFGEETAFLVAALIVFWCVDKQKGYYLMAVGFIGTMLNQVTKLLCRVPRPWVLDPNFTILEQAREAATGYSFPSGHSQSAVGTFGGLALVCKKRWVKAAAAAIAVLVPFSRMYVGVHTPADVLAGAATALVLILALRSFAGDPGEKAMRTLFAGMAVLAAGMLAFMLLYPFPADVDAHNLSSGVKNSYTMLGCIPGVITVYYLERKYIRFETDACFLAQALKVVLGLALVLVVKEGLRGPLEALFAGHMLARAVRYYLIVVVAGLLWPMTFRGFAKMGRKDELR